MMQFLNDFEKMDKVRNMGFTLQFFLSVDILVTAATYYAMKTLGLLNEDDLYDDYIYMGWIAVLLVSMLPMALTTASTFAKIRLVYRITHMLMFVGVFWMYNDMLFPKYFIIYYCIEMYYLQYGINTAQMEFPGKWMAEATDKYQDKKAMRQEEKEQAPPTFPFTRIAHEVIRMDCTIEDEYIDDLFEYHTACEDEHFPSFIINPKKTTGTFLV